MPYLPFDYLASSHCCCRRDGTEKKNKQHEVNIKLNLYIYLSFSRYAKLNVVSNKYQKPSEVRMTIYTEKKKLVASGTGTINEARKNWQSRDPKNTAHNVQAQLLLYQIISFENFIHLKDTHREREREKEKNNNNISRIRFPIVHVYHNCKVVEANK